mmetsp:Transcript_35610/g.86185  ORF Transcript_35610/g.86185 Transcript_35610/m.86185 type:complete len:100 (-) Transcript_35610:310-609(-)
MFCRKRSKTIYHTTPELQDIYHQIVEIMATTAKLADSYICYGTPSGENPTKKEPQRRKGYRQNLQQTTNNNNNNTDYYYIRQKVVDSNGISVTRNDKVR